MSTSPDLGFPLIAESQAQPEITHNEMVVMMQVFLKGVITIQNAPPGSPTPGDSYIAGTSPIGLWAGRANCLTTWTAGGWRFVPDRNDAGTPIAMGARQTGMRVFVISEDNQYFWSGSAWGPAPEGGIQSVVAGTNITIDDTDPSNPIINATGGGGSGIVETIEAGFGIEVDDADPANPIVSAVSEVVEISTDEEDLLQSMASQYLRFTDTVAKILNIPLDATETIEVNSQFNFRNCAEEDLILVPEGGVTINVPTNGSLILAEGMAATLIKVAADEWDLIGYTVLA